MPYPLAVLQARGDVPLFAGLLVPLCVAAVLTAVFHNFLRARESGPVETERKSPVATGSMLLVTFLVYLLISRRVGVAPVRSALLMDVTVGIGAFLLVFGTIVNIAGRFHLGRNWANQVTVYEEQTLVTTGAFRYVRHPLYASLLCMFYGACLIYHNAAAFAVTTLVFLPMVTLRARQEETLLLRRFPEYKAYRARVGMFLPRLSGGFRHG